MLLMNALYIFSVKVIYKFMDIASGINFYNSGLKSNDLLT